MTRFAALLLLAVLCLPMTATAADAPKELRILRVTPAGENAQSERQIVIQFNRPVVPLGRMQVDAAKLPVKIEPAIKCDWRWLNTSALACNLSDADKLATATRYSIDIAPGITAEDGATTAETFHHEFTTQRPDARYGWVRGWQSAGRPVVALNFTVPVTRDSAAAAIVFAVPAGGSTHDVAVDVMPETGPRPTPDAIQVPGEKWWLFWRHDDKAAGEPLPLREGETQNARFTWLVAPREDLPADTEIPVRVKAGLATPLGSEKGMQEHQVYSLRTFPELKFLGIECYKTGSDAEQLTVSPGDDAQQKKCDPMRAISLAFSAPVQTSVAAKALQFSPVLPIETQDIWGNGDYSRIDGSAHAQGRTYGVSLPRGLKANSSYHVSTRDAAAAGGLWARITAWFHRLFDKGAAPATGIVDEFGRALPAPIDITLYTDNRSPNYVMPYRDAVLESQIDSEVPLYVNNLEKTAFAYTRLTPTGVKAGLVSAKTLPAVRNLQYAVPLGVREMLGGKSGVVYGNLSVTPPIDKYNTTARLFAEVTPFQMHLKLGHFSSLLWVTDMQSGQPVAGAKVSVYRDRMTALAGGRMLTGGVTGADGLVKMAGTDSIDPNLDTYNNAWNDDDERLFVRVDKGGEMGLLPVDNAFLIDTYRSVGESVYYNNQPKYGHMKAWGTTAQGVYRAGDSIDFKLYVRNQDDSGLIPPPRKGYRLSVIDPTDTVVYRDDKVTLNDFGAYAGKFTVPETAAVGWYRFELTSDDADKVGGITRTEKAAGNDPEDADANEGGDDEGLKWQPMRVLVSDFTPAPFHVTSQLNADAVRPGQALEVTTRAQLHSGGPYGAAGARVTGMMTVRAFQPADGPARDFTFGSDENVGQQVQVFQREDVLDDNGELRQTFTVDPQNVYYGRLMVESAVRDERGKNIAAVASADYVGVDRFVGLKARDWMSEAGKPAHIDWAVTDEKGALVSGADVTIKIERLETKAARVKGAGNAYVTEYTDEWKPAGDCRGASAAQPQDCAFTPDTAGRYRATASVTDTKGAVHKSDIGLYVTGAGRVVWQESADASLEIVPEKTSYKPGETARYMVKNPYPGAEALVTIERYGIIDSFVQKLDGNAPVIEFPVKADYIPGFYLSVVVFSPRVEKPIENQVDLGKPSYRIGYVTVPVEDVQKQLDITVTADREVYRPRDHVELTLTAKPKAGGAAEPTELAVAVVDDAVFDLITGGRGYFDPYAGFYSLDSLDLRNYSLLQRLVGRQKFEKKGANPGGDGGSGLSLRDQFKFVAFWAPDVPVDAQGQAHVSFNLPDNLTGWHVLALGVTPRDKMGLGEGGFKVNQDTEVRPVMPNQVLEGDSFMAGFSVMNRTDHPRDLKVTITAAGNAVMTDGKAPTVQKTVTLKPYERSTVYLPVTATLLPIDSQQRKGEIRFAASAGDDSDRDAMAYALPVGKKRMAETVADYGSTDGAHAEVSLAVPQGIYTDTGGITLVTAPSVIGNVKGAFAYMRDYPYMCWEQQLTKAAMAMQYGALQSYMPDATLWPGADKLPAATLAGAAAFQAPNGGMSYFVPRDEYADPYLSAYTALAFGWLREGGYDVPQNVSDKLDDYLQAFLTQDSMPDGYDGGMASTVRAVALSALAAEGKTELSDLERFRPHLPEMSLLGKAQFLQAALATKGGDPAAQEAARLIFNQADESGGKLSFNETLDDGYDRILSTPLRDNCAVLSALTEMASHGGKLAELAGDTPAKLVRMITQARGSRTHWENTQENMFCMQAMAAYARVYEKDKPDMTVTARLDGQDFGQASFHALADPAQSLHRAFTPEDEGRKAALAIDKQGTGRLYYSAQMTFADKAPAANATNAGMNIRREYSIERNGKWELLKSPMTLKPSELVRVDLYLSLPAARNFVVVDDPVPGGLEPVNRDLATASSVDADKGEFTAAGGSWYFQFDDWISYNATFWSFYHKELRNDAARFYADYLPPGNYHLSYTAQAVAPGDYVVMPVKAVEMYDPDVFGRGVEEKLSVQP